MSNSVLYDEIDSFKEVLSTMPVNNKKNKIKYCEYIDSLIDDYMGYRDSFRREIDCRIREINSKIDKSNYDYKIDDINNYIDKLQFLNDKNTSYEKCGLDRIVDDILHFYNVDLNSVNGYINKAVDVFFEVGVKLGDKDFCFTPFVNTYMKDFFKVRGDDNIFFDYLKESFDKLYWKSPNLIFQIGLNLNFLYYKYKKNFDRYYKNKVNDIICNEGIGLELIVDKYREIASNYNDSLRSDMRLIVDSFLDKKFNINDFSEDKILKCYSQFGIDKDINIINIYGLYNSLIEYKGYMEFRYIYLDILSKYREKNSYSNVFNNKLKNISKIEGEVIKLNRKIRFNSKFSVGAGKLDKLVLEINKKLDELYGLYKELEDDKFNQLINKLEDDTSIYDCLYIASSYYKYLKKCIKANNEGVELYYVWDVIERFRKFLMNPCINIISNIGIVEDIDIPLIISDRYKLLGINISSDDIENNADAIIDSVFKIILSDIIDKSKLGYDDILFLVKVKDLVD